MVEFVRLKVWMKLQRLDRWGEFYRFSSASACAAIAGKLRFTGLFLHNWNRATCSTSLSSLSSIYATSFFLLGLFFTPNYSNARVPISSPHIHPNKRFSHGESLKFFQCVIPQFSIPFIAFEGKRERKLFKILCTGCL